MTAPIEQSLFQRQHRHIPAVDVANWYLILDGDVSQSLTLDYSTLTAFPAIQSHTVMMCKGHTAGTPLLAEVTWQGVSVPELLKRAQPGDRARVANIHSADGYVTSLPLPELDAALLAHTLNGAPLPAEHGYPLRLVVPGKLGYKLPKWITHIILTEEPAHGYWERLGVDPDGNAPPVIAAASNAIQGSTDQALTLYGYAYGGAQQVTAVEASIDGGPWMPLAFTGGGIGRLASWQARWQPALPGRYPMRLRVLAGAAHATTTVMIEVA